MGWSTTAPTLPSGSSWVQKDTVWYENNNLKITGTIYVARLNGTNFAVRVTETRTFYRSYFDDTYHRCDIGGATGTAYTGSWPANSGSTVSYYFTGVAAAGASIKVVVGRKASLHRLFLLFHLLFLLMHKVALLVVQLQEIRERHTEPFLPLHADIINFLVGALLPQVQI